jgi:hypothetical protein
LVDAETARFHDALFQTPPLSTGVLKVQIGIVNLVGSDGTQGFGQMGFVQAKRLEQQGSGCGQAFKSGFA